MARKKGCQDPSKCVFLVSQERKSEYKQAVKIYEASGRKVLKWQKQLLAHITARNKDKLYTYTKFGYSVPRRNGKSEILALREIQGLFDGEKILHTAHRTSTSHNAWMTLCRILNDAGYVDQADIKKEEESKYDKDKFYKAHKANGLESIELLATGGTIAFRTRTSKGGLGEGFDLLVIDEAQEYMDDQESSLKYTVSSSKNGQTIMCGTPPTAVSSGTVFVNFRNKCLEGKTKNSGWAEWSVDEMTDPNDHDARLRCNPSLGYILSERAVEDEIGDDEVDFNIQRLGLWLKYNQKSEISENTWNALKAAVIPQFKGQLHVGIKFGIDGRNIALAVAVKTVTEQIFVELVDVRPTIQGIAWVTEFLQKADYCQAYSDGKSGQEMLENAAKEHKLKKIKFPTVDEVIAANALFEQAVNDGSICHNGQYTLADVVTNCKRRTIGSRGGFGYASLIDGQDIAIMDAVIFAYYSCKTVKERKPQRVSY